VGTTVHLHGGHVAPTSDGHPTDLISPGRSKDYVYPNSQVASTLWYHDHAVHHTSENVYRGLAGAYLIRDGVEGQLNLPSGAYDVVCIVQDRSFNADGSLAFVDSHNAVLGDTIVVNGKPWPNFKVHARKYRLRFVNGSNTRDYELSLDSGKPLVQIGSDGGLLAAPHTTPSIRMVPGERVEVVVDFSQYTVGSKVVLKNLAGSSTDGTDKIMRFEVFALPPEPDASKVPSTLRSITRLTGASVTRDFTLSLNRTTGLWVINGKAFDPNPVDVRPKLDVAEIWKLTNSSGMAHPFHMHLAMFQVLDRDGDPNKVNAGEKGWKDTVRVGPGSTVRVITKFTGFTGKYVYHCHNLAHEDHDMMAQMEVVA
jgi:spore coat protein A